MTRLVASKAFEGLDELIDALEDVKNEAPEDVYPGVEGSFAIMGYCVLRDEGNDLWIVEITDKSSPEIEAVELN